MKDGLLGGLWRLFYYWVVQRKAGSCQLPHLKRLAHVMQRSSRHLSDRVQKAFDT
jgi:hypothetical protein